MGEEILHMGLQITVPYILHIKHTYNASSSISSLGFFLDLCQNLKMSKKKTSSFYNFCLVPNLLQLFCPEPNSINLLLVFIIGVFLAFSLVFIKITTLFSHYISWVYEGNLCNYSRYYWHKQV